MVLRAGTKAPDFTLNKSPDETLSLSDLRGRPAILAFYPADWSPVCRSVVARGSGRRGAVTLDARVTGLND